jgi:hypothetical protein
MGEHSKDETQKDTSRSTPKGAGLDGSTKTSNKDIKAPGTGKSVDMPQGGQRGGTPTSGAGTGTGRADQDGQPGGKRDKNADRGSEDQAE